MILAIALLATEPLCRDQQLTVLRHAPAGNRAQTYPDVIRQTG